MVTLQVSRSDGEPRTWSLEALARQHAALSDSRQVGTASCLRAVSAFAALVSVCLAKCGATSYSSMLQVRLGSNGLAHNHLNAAKGKKERRTLADKQKTSDHALLGF